MAWIRATPDKAKTSRLAARKAEGLTVDYPDVAPFGLLVSYMDELGHAGHGSEGFTGLTLSDIEAWARIGGVSLPMWLATLLRDLSREYAAQANVSNKTDCPPPYTMRTTEADLATRRKRADQKLRGLFAHG